MQEVQRREDLLFDSDQIDCAHCPLGNCNRAQRTIVFGQEDWLGHPSCCQYSISVLYLSCAIGLAALSCWGRNV